VYLEECLSSIRARGAFQKTEWSHLCIFRFLKYAPLHVSFTKMCTYACFVFRNVHLCMFHFPKCPTALFFFSCGEWGQDFGRSKLDKQASSSITRCWLVLPKELLILVLQREVENTPTSTSHHLHIWVPM
jgi:hypothetical protein